MLPGQELSEWHFGFGIRMKFDSNPPSIDFNTQIGASEGCSSICDGNGNLLFYSNGISIWNKNNDVMLNGNNLLGGWSSTQSSLIIPKPGFVDSYFVFTTDEQGGTNGLNYSEVNMTLDGGKGAVTSKNLSLYSPVCEKLTAAYHANDTNIWVVIHGLNDNNFYAYLVSDSGVSLTPVISSIGVAHLGGFANNNTAGFMKFSPNGEYLGLATSVSSDVEIFKFNKATGILSDCVNLGDSIWGPYGIEFSPDNSKFYVAAFELYQFDLSVYIDSAVRMSETVIHPQNSITNEFFTNLALGPDGKIYALHSSSNNGLRLGVINAPNNAGAFCNFDSLAISDTHISSPFSLPNNFSGLFHNSFLSVESNVKSEAQLFFAPNPFLDETLFYISEGFDGGIIEIYTNLGELYLTKDEVYNNQGFDELRMCKSGIYFWRYSKGEFKSSGKLLKF